jgi:hypothetical protein
VPEGVRQVVGHRLARLSQDANRLLSVASGFQNDFSFQVARQVVGLDEEPALDALDEALDAGVVRSLGGDGYEFSHDLIRHTLYAVLNPSRHLRLHRRIAGVMEQVWGEAAEHVGEIAWQYHSSAELPGAERGVPFCVAAADRAEQSAAPDEVAVFLRMALDLLPEGDPRRPRTLARLGLALADSSAIEAAAQVATDAAAQLAEAAGEAAAADYLAEIAPALTRLESVLGWRVAEQGLRYMGNRRDLSWAALAELDQERRDATDPANPGFPLDSPVRREIARVILSEPDTDLGEGLGPNLAVGSREEVLSRSKCPTITAFLAGDFRRALAVRIELLKAHFPRGRLHRAGVNLAHQAVLRAALGDFSAAEGCIAWSSDLAARAQAREGDQLWNNLTQARAELAWLRLEGLEYHLVVCEAYLKHSFAGTRWGLVSAAAACFASYLGRAERARECLAETLPAIVQSPGWSDRYTLAIHLAIETLWVLQQDEHAELLEENLREKILAPDFRAPHTDACLSLARLSALQARWDEAVQWFARARPLLEEQGARWRSRELAPCGPLPTSTRPRCTCAGATPATASARSRCSKPPSPSSMRSA